IPVYNFSDTTNLMIPAVPTATINSTLAILRERYLEFGIEARITFDPVANLIDLPPGSSVNLNSVGTFTFTGGFPSLTPSVDQSALMALVRAKEPAVPAVANTLFILFVGHFTSG